MRKILFYSFLIGCLSFASACLKKPKDEGNTNVIGALNVDLNANEAHIRTQESLIGNFICDAVKSGLESYNNPVDFVLMNSGSIRFDQTIRPNGIYAKGSFSSDMVDEMLPFSENKMVKVELTGLQLKEILERSVALLPNDKGSFLQLSKELSFTADLTKQAQIIDQTVTPNVIQSAGQRIIAVIYKGLPIDDLLNYYVAVPDYIANGNDGYVTFYNIDLSKKTIYNLSPTNLVREQVIINSPIVPILEGRIKL